ncbi:hypothetical protein ABIC08_000616 [Bradyrhizobium sp. RT9b]|uniref:septal ring lytic transglycosylase RlpA family protein n=1 Tax=unclassified Bradyrhizobium TaxID=2631580 RepID=UPI0033961398
MKTAFVAAIALACLVSSAAAAEICIASQYGVGDGYHGRRTASGARFNTYARAPFTIAHKTRPFGSQVTITRGRDGHYLVLEEERRAQKKPRLSGALESSCSISSASGSFGEPTRHDQVGGVSRFRQSPLLIHSRKMARQDAGQKWQFTSEQFMLMNDQRLQLCHA